MCCAWTKYLGLKEEKIMAEMKKTAAKETAEPVEKITAKADALKIDTKEPE